MLECDVCDSDFVRHSTTSVWAQRYCAKNVATPWSTDRNYGTIEWNVCPAAARWVPSAMPKCRRVWPTRCRWICLRRSPRTAETIGTSFRCNSKSATRHWSCRARLSTFRTRSPASAVRLSSTGSFLWMRVWFPAAARRFWGNFDWNVRSKRLGNGNDCDQSFLPNAPECAQHTRHI